MNEEIDLLYMYNIQVVTLAILQLLNSERYMYVAIFQVKFVNHVDNSMSISCTGLPQLHQHKPYMYTSVVNKKLNVHVNLLHIYISTDGDNHTYSQISTSQSRSIRNKSFDIQPWSRVAVILWQLTSFVSSGNNTK